MNREQRVEKAARAIHDYHGCTDSCEFRGCDLDSLRAVAEFVTDVLVPQIGTVEEVIALPEETVAIDPRGSVLRWHKAATVEGSRYRAQVYLKDGPLTVVWQP